MALTIKPTLNCCLYYSAEITPCQGVLQKNLFWISLARRNFVNCFKKIDSFPSRKYNEVTRFFGGVMLLITYDPLWETMRRKGITTYTLIKKYAFSRGTLDSLKQGRNISTATSAASSPVKLKRCFAICLMSLLLKRQILKNVKRLSKRLDSLLLYPNILPTDRFHHPRKPGNPQNFSQPLYSFPFLFYNKGEKNYPAPNGKGC